MRIPAQCRAAGGIYAVEPGAEADVRTRLLNLVRRAAGDARPDAALLARLDDPAAFAELVARHGPMVWGVCRNMLGEADAEDAFQATFVALLRAKVRDGAARPAWLHAAAAVPEAAAPPDDWADTMAVVHREIARLPAADRSAFVLCVLEGVTQAAARLGRTAGAVAGQVARAKRQLVERLRNRGIVPGLAALGTASAAGAVPPGLVNRVTGPGVISPAVLRLAKGAVGMTTAKLVAAAVLVGTALASVFLSASAVPDPGAPPHGYRPTPLRAGRVRPGWRRCSTASGRAGREPGP